MSRMKQADERGAALLTAMIIVTLVASLAAAMVWRQYRAVQIEAAERARAQGTWILEGALDYARLFLREDARENQKTPVDHLNEVWAVPLAESRLSTFLAMDQSNADEGPEAFLSGTIADAQAQYNLRQLLTGSATPALELRVLQRLCETAGAPPNTAELIAAKLRAAYSSSGSGSTGSGGGGTSSGDIPLPPQNLDQLAWFGLGADTIERLRPLVTLLPTVTPVNLNTAPREVIAALFDGMDLASAQRIVQIRQSSPFNSPQDIKPYLPTGIEVTSERASVMSSYFIVTGRLRLEERLLEERSLVRRVGLDMVVQNRQRIAQVVETRR